MALGCPTRRQVPFSKATPHTGHAFWQAKKTRETCDDWAIGLIAVQQMGGWSFLEGTVLKGNQQETLAI